MGNKDTGPESIDKPFKRRRNMGQMSGGKVTRADAVARYLSRARTVRELADLTIQLGAPERLVYNILNRPHRNSIKVMHLHSTARHFYKKRKAEQRKRKRAWLPPGLARKVYRPDPEPGHGQG